MDERRSYGIQLCSRAWHLKKTAEIRHSRGYRRAYLHCAKALIRSHLWKFETQIERKSLPSLGRMIADQIEGIDAQESEAYIEQSYRDRLY